MTDLLHPEQWSLLTERSLLREWFGLRLWLLQPLEMRREDDNARIRELAAQVLSIDTSSPQDLMESYMHDAELQNVAGRLLQLAQKNGNYAPALTSEFKAKLHAEIKQMRRQLVSETQLLRFPFQQLRNVVPLITAFFFLSGYFLVAWYLGYFGIRVSRFFSLWDYISSSIDALRFMIASLLSTSLLLVYSFRRVKLNVLRQCLHVRLLMGTLLWTGMILQLFMTILLFWLDLPEKQNALGFCTFYFLAFIVARLSVYFRQALRATFLISFATIYGIALYSMIEGSIAFASSAFSPTEPLYRILRVNNPQSDPGSTDSGPYRLIAGNSQWLFIQDTTLKIHAVPVQQIVDVVRIDAREPTLAAPR